MTGAWSATQHKRRNHAPEHLTLSFTVDRKRGRRLFNDVNVNATQPYCVVSCGVVWCRVVASFIRTSLPSRTECIWVAITGFPTSHWTKTAASLSLSLSLSLPFFSLLCSTEGISRGNERKSRKYDGWIQGGNKFLTLARENPAAPLSRCLTTRQTRFHAAQRVPSNGCAEIRGREYEPAGGSRDNYRGH